MATFRASKPPNPIEISRYLGVNESVGETEITLGEAVKQVNFRITNNYKAQKRQGHNTFIDYANTKNVQGLWHGEIGNKEVLISCNDSKVYEYNFVTEVNSQIGTLTDAKTTIFYFNSKLYFLNGADYKEYDGTTFQDVDPYIPTIAIATPPAGGGSVFESINLLTGKKKQEFQGNGVATEYQLAETNIDADLVVCTIDGATKVENTDFTVNRTTGKVTFTLAPANGSLVIPNWTKVDATHANLVKKNKYVMTFGPGNDTAIFLWGNPEQKNRRMWSGTLKANYFPVFSFTLIGSDEFAITDIKPHYSRQIIFKEDRTHYSYAEYVSNTETYDYPVYDLNEKVGNIAFNGAQIVENDPISLHGQSWYRWTSTNTEDERNASNISERLRESLSVLNLSQAVTFDYQKEKEYWCNVGDKVYIWNYGNDTMYIYDNVQATCFLDIAGLVYCGANGKIERFEGLNDNGVAINAVLELGFTDFGVNELVKNTRKLWLTIQPQSKTSVSVLYRTNRPFESEDKSIMIGFILLDFNIIDFDNFSFKTNRAPQTYRKKIRAKKYAYIKFIFMNDKLNESLIILNMKVMAETSSEVK